MIRTKRKINKQRGSRSNGGGCTKKRRGAGNKGGKGKAGMGKQHWTWTVIHDPDHFGKHGFKRPQKMIKKVMQKETKVKFSVILFVEKF